MTISPGPGPGAIFQIFPYLFAIAFIVIIGTIIFRSVAGLQRWQSNNQQPVLTVNAKIVSKRMEVSRHSQNMNNQHHDTTMSHYYVTFEVDSGDRMELEVNGGDYGLLAEGDVGNLTFQGTRFKGFDRRM